MQAIRTRYFGPTDTRGSRIQAKAEAGALYVGFDHSLNIQDNHKAACDALLKKLKWRPCDANSYTPLVGGVFNGDYYWVFTERN
jgi:hypothetical protein